MPYPAFLLKSLYRSVYRSFFTSLISSGQMNNGSWLGICFIQYVPAYSSYMNESDKYEVIYQIYGQPPMQDDGKAGIDETGFTILNG